MKYFQKHKNISKYLAFTVMLLLSLPIIQQYTHIVKLKALHGYVTKKEYSPFTFETWFNGVYQDNTEEYLKKNIGFANFFIRTYNQMEYTFYNKARAKGVIIGKEGYLYEENYIKAYLGRDFIGKKAIADKVYKLKKIQDTLQSLNIQLCVVMAPGKASFFPEYIPDSYVPQNITTTNLEVYIDEMQKRKVNYLNFNKWFIQNKYSSSYPLFPKNGIHWSKYGEILAADSLISYMESTMDIAMPHVVVKDITTSYSMQGTDDDIEKGMNILFDIPDNKMAYPKIEFSSDSNTVVPKVLTIADSYYWGMFNYKISDKVFNKGKFWYYNKKIYPDSFKKELYVDDIDIKEEIEKNDMILILSTDANLYKFAFGFIDQTYNEYYNKEYKIKKANEDAVNKYIQDIKNTPEWIKSVKEKAKRKGTSLEEEIRKNAEYMVREDNK